MIHEQEIALQDCQKLSTRAFDCQNYCQGEDTLLDLSYLQHNTIKVLTIT